MDTTQLSRGRNQVVAAVAENRASSVVILLAYVVDAHLLSFGVTEETESLSYWAALEGCTRHSDTPKKSSFKRIRPKGAGSSPARSQPHFKKKGVKNVPSKKNT